MSLPVVRESPLEVDAGKPLQRRRRLLESSGGIIFAQFVIVVVFLSAWQWLPSVGNLSKTTHLLDPFFISSPSRVAKRLYELLFGLDAATPMWLFIGNTVVAAGLGLVIGLGAGAISGLIVGSSRVTARIVRPFVIAMNSIPRIALIPIIVLIFGPTFSGEVAISVIVVFFIGFFNAYEGAVTVPPQLIQNAKVMNAGSTSIVLQVRLPYALAWTLASLPLAATFSILTVVTGEILTGYPGLGRLVGQASATADSDLTFAVVIVLAAVGLAVVGLTEMVKRRILHWWGDNMR